MLIVMQYGLLPPRKGAEIVREQMRLAHRYQNTLIEIERGRRAALREVIGTAVIDAERATAAARAALEAALTEVRGIRKSTKARAVPSIAMERLKQARVAHRTATSELAAARAKAREDQEIVEQIKLINERKTALQKSARRYCGTYWASYLLVEQAVEATTKMPLYDGDLPNDPRFVRWSGEGRVGVQIQKGMPADSVYEGKDTRLQIDPVNSLAWAGAGHRPSNYRILMRTRLRMRVGSNENGEPVWAEWPLILHRPMPEGARIKGAVVHVRLCGPHEKWSLEVTVDKPTPRKRPVSGVVGVDLGWRMFGDEQRVAAWHGDDGQTGEVRVDVGPRLKQTHELASIRDQHFNLALGWLREILPAALPEWFATATATIGRWKAQGRLAALVTRWRTQRFAGDDTAFAGAEAWRKKDKHLWTWESALRQGALLARKEQYRIVASVLAKRYRWVSLEKFDLRTFAVRQPEAAKGEGTPQRYTQRVAAPGEFKRTLQNAFGPYVVEVDAQNTTRQCNTCGHTEAFDAAREVWRECPACKKVWDQDENAAVNICERGGGELPAATARVAEMLSKDGEKREGRWAKAKRLRAEKDANQATARKPDVNAA